MEIFWLCPISNPWKHVLDTLSGYMIYETIFSSVLFPSIQEKQKHFICMSPILTVFVSLFIFWISYLPQLGKHHSRPTAPGSARGFLFTPEFFCFFVFWPLLLHICLRGISCLSLWLLKVLPDSGLYSQQGGRGFDPEAWGVTGWSFQVPFCLHRFSPRSPASSHRPENCSWGEWETLNRPSAGVSVSMVVFVCVATLWTAQHVQGVSTPAFTLKQLG